MRLTFRVAAAWDEGNVSNETLISYFKVNLNFYENIFFYA